MKIDRVQQAEDFRVLGINYKKSDAAVRGLFAINPDQYTRLLQTASQFGISDFFVLSTCNRTELYGFADSVEMMSVFLCSVCPGEVEVFNEISYSKSGDNAIEHLYQVAAGLDSQILGDYEILGQIKNAVKISKIAGFVGPFMERLINSVLQASKAVKTQTALSSGTVSVSFAAIQCIRAYLDENKMQANDTKIVLVGTGKIGRVTCRNMVDYLCTSNIVLVNRTESTAVELANQMGLSSAPLHHLEDQMNDASIIVVSTNAPDPVILANHLDEKGKKLVIDISVPCNVATDAQVLDNVTFVDVDRLSKIKDETLQKRKEEVPFALRIIAEHIADFKEWCDMRKHVPVLKEVKSKLLALPLSCLLPSDVQDATALFDTSSREEKVQKTINSLATNMRRNYTPGCHYIQAINEFIG